MSDQKPHTWHNVHTISIGHMATSVECQSIQLMYLSYSNRIIFWIYLTSTQFHPCLPLPQGVFAALKLFDTSTPSATGSVNSCYTYLNY